MRNVKAIKYPNEQQTELYDRITKLETKIIDKVQTLKKGKKYYECKHYQNLPEECQPYDPSVNYYQKFWKTLILNQMCNLRIGEVKDYIDTYNDNLEEIEELLNKHEQLTGSRGKKKSRRTAQQIEKKYACPYQKCYKTYGTQVSLNLHIKLKHNGGNKSDREKAAELIWQAREKNKSIPQFYINLPPGFIEEYGKLTNRIQKEQKEEDQILQ